MTRAKDLETPAMEFGDIGNTIEAHAEAIVTGLAALIAFFSALLARQETRRQRQIQKEALRTQIDNASLGWGNIAIDTLGRAAAFARTRHMQANDAAFKATQTNALIAISALVERGRMFFPNIDPQGKGTDKEGAYRGSRAPILDAMMWAYYEVEALTREGGPTGENSAQFIEDCRRLLVSELQAHLDPHRRDEIIERYDAQREVHRKDALRRANDLYERLCQRRPGLSPDSSRGTHYHAATGETLQ